MAPALALTLALLLLTLLPSRYRIPPPSGSHPPFSPSSARHFVPRGAMGVAECRLVLRGDAFAAALHMHNYSDPLVLHIMLRYATRNGTATVKGVMAAQLVQPLPKDFQRKEDPRVDPMLTLRRPSRAAAGGVGAGAEAVVRLDGGFTFPFTVKHPDGFMLYGNRRYLQTDSLQARFALPAVPRRPMSPNTPKDPDPDPEPDPHVYVLSSFASDTTCTLDLGRVPNVLDSRGKDVELELEADKEPTQSLIILSPLYNVTSFSDALVTLLDAHIRWHRALGFSRHVLYVRPRDVDMFGASRTLRQWVERGALVMVLWDFKVPENIFSLDQYVVYNHAMLAFTGQQVYLAYIDLDEYFMSLRRDLPAIQDMARECSHGKPKLPAKGRPPDPSSASRQLPYNIVVQRWDALMLHHNRSERELDRWLQLGQKGQPGEQGQRGAEEEQGLGLGQGGRGQVGEQQKGQWLNHTGTGMGQGEAGVSNSSTGRQRRLRQGGRGHGGGRRRRQLLSAQQAHPITWYSKVRYPVSRRQPWPKSLVRPEAISTQSVHWGNQHEELPRHAQPHRTCLFLLHLKALFGVRPGEEGAFGSDEALAAAKFVDDQGLAEELQRRSAALDERDNV